MESTASISFGEIVKKRELWFSLFYINISDYYKWLYSTRKSLPAVNGYIAKDIDGNIVPATNYTLSYKKETDTT